METINLLVAGHVKARLNVSDDVLKQRLTDILAIFKSSELPNQSFEILTGVVDGVDVASIDTALQLGMSVNVIAPSSQDLDRFASEYPELAKQLKSQACFFEGDNISELEEKQLKAIRDQEALYFADMLLVAWDGADTLEGGTVQLTLTALQNQIPVVWLNTKDNLSMHIVDADKANAQWQVRIKLPLNDANDIKAVFKPVNDSDLSEYIQSFQKVMGNQEKLPKVKRSFAGVWHKLPTWLISINCGALKKLAEEPARLNPYTKPTAWLGKANASKFYDTTPLKKTFSDYDVAATHFADRHRDSVFLLYFLSAIAVFSAVAGSIYLWVAKGSHAWGWVEVAAIATIILILWIATKAHWHPKWARYRFIAEQVRYAQVSMVLFHLPPVLAKGAGFQYFKKTNGDLKSLNFMKLVRQSFVNLPKVLVGVISCQGSKDHKTTFKPKRINPISVAKQAIVNQGLPKKSGESIFVASSKLADKAQLLKDLVDDQLDYHKNNATKLHTLHHRMHKLSMALFIMTVIAVIAHFFIYASWLLIFTAAFPAFAAAMHGILTKLELSKIHNQSHQLVHKLENLSAVLEKDLGDKRFELESVENFVYLRALYEQATRLMSQEAEQWQDLISSQEPELPA
jgi:hypothetical protein